jgi:prephenate dehydrogenase
MPGRITIVGLGTTGSAIGRSLMHAALEGIEVVGHDKEPPVAKAAERAGYVHRIDRNLPSSVAGAQLVIMATPPAQSLDTLGFIAADLEPGCVVTDTHGTKAALIERAREVLPESVSFVPGHLLPAKIAPFSNPAQPFEGGSYCIVADGTTPTKAVRDVSNLAALLGAEPYFLSLEEHDSFTAATDLLPTAIAAALMATVRRSGGLKDIERVAGRRFRLSTEAAMARPVDASLEFRQNAGQLHRWLDEVIADLDEMRDLLESGSEEDAERLLDVLAEAYVSREAWSIEGHERYWEEPGPSTDAKEGMRMFFTGNLFRRRRGDQDD